MIPLLYMFGWLQTKLIELDETLTSRSLAKKRLVSPDPEDSTCVCGCGREVVPGWDGMHGR